MQGFLYEEATVWAFLIVTGLGAWAAWMTARGMALAWKPFWQCALAVLALGGAVRFLHYALFEGTLLSLRYYLTDTLILLAVAAAGYRITRTRQMTRQYRWLYERTGPFTWRERREAEPPSLLPR